MFGVSSAAHAVSRSAKTSPGAARNNAIPCPMSLSSALHRRNPPIPNSPDHFFTQAHFPSILTIGDRLCEYLGRTRTSTRYFRRAGGHATCIVRRSSRSPIRVFQPPLASSGPLSCKCPKCDCLDEGSIEELQRSFRLPLCPMRLAYRRTGLRVRTRVPPGMWLEFAQRDLRGNYPQRETVQL